MKISKNQRKILEEGLKRARTNKEKWQVVLIVIIPFITGNKIEQDSISARDGSPRHAEKNIVEVVFGKEMVIITQGSFWNLDEYQYIGTPLCRVPRLSFRFEDTIPRLEGNKLYLGAVTGWGNEPWYLKLE